MTNSIITRDLVDLGLEAPDRQTATRRLAAGGRVTDLDGFLADVTAREQQMPTGIEGGIGIPHARSAFVTEPTLAFARSKAGVDFGAADVIAAADAVIFAADVEVRNRERFAGKPAIVTERGGPTSHTAILAKTLGIPAVVLVGAGVAAGAGAGIPGQREEKERRRRRSSAGRGRGHRVLSTHRADGGTARRGAAA